MGRSADAPVLAVVAAVLSVALLGCGVMGLGVTAVAGLLLRPGPRTTAWPSATVRLSVAPTVAVAAATATALPAAVATMAPTVTPMPTVTPTFTATPTPGPVRLPLVVRDDPFDGCLCDMGDVLNCDSGDALRCFAVCKNLGFDDVHGLDRDNDNLACEE